MSPSNDPDRPAPTAPESGVPRDDHRPPGSPRAGIAPGQLDVAAALAATHDGAGEPLPAPEDRIAQGLTATEPTPEFPKPGSADTAPDDQRTFDRLATAPCRRPKRTPPTGAPATKP
ncbi:hypothetical protein IP88_16535 [alpha proteobacterium AAP81b]|nr:hypothetical protein IP88_16535 [alpha proteobacterium AAP81b]